MTLRVALTGNAASGKSTVAERWRQAGVPMVSADVLAREVVAPGTPGFDQIREAFGDRVVGGFGTLDRARLRDQVFRDAAARKRLEAITHPLIQAGMDEFIAEQTAAGAALVVAEVPLLYEVGREVAFDRVVFVDAPEAARLERLVTTRGLDEAEARRLMAAQGNPAEKRARAHHIVVNDGTLGQLAERADAVMQRLRAEAADWTAPEGGRESESDPESQPDSAAASRSSRTDRSPSVLASAPATMRIDLHMHTWGSWDCTSDPERVLAAARARGVQRIAITDHNRLHVALEMAARYPDQVIPGEEVKTAEGIDVIGLYLHTEIPKGTPAADTCRMIREQGGIAYLPHPYAKGKGGSGRYADQLAPLCEVVEVFNARLHPGRLNEPAPDLAARHGCLWGAGSDAHTVGEVAGAWVEVPAHPNTAAGLRAALAHGRVHGTTASNLVHLASTWAKVRKWLPGGR